MIQDTKKKTIYDVNNNCILRGIFGLARPLTRNLKKGLSQTVKRNVFLIPFRLKCRQKKLKT